MSDWSFILLPLQASTSDTVNSSVCACIVSALLPFLVFLPLCFRFAVFSASFSLSSQSLAFAVMSQVWNAALAPYILKDQATEQEVMGTQGCQSVKIMACCAQMVPPVKVSVPLFRIKCFDCSWDLRLELTPTCPNLKLSSPESGLASFGFGSSMA